MNLGTSSIDVGIVTLLDNYFELMHAQDMSLFDKVFHESCSLFGVPDGTINIRSFAVYKEAMQNRSLLPKRARPVATKFFSLTSSTIHLPLLACNSK